MRTWTDIEGHQIKGVYGIPRGGLVPAVMASHALGVPLHMVPCVHDLVVDDISDTGATLADYRARLFPIATVLTTATTATPPDLCLRVREDDWAVFPWEVSA